MDHTSYHHVSSYNPNDYNYFHNLIHEPPPHDQLHYVEPYSIHPSSHPNHPMINPINPSSNLLNPSSNLLNPSSNLLNPSSNILNPSSKLAQQLIQMCHCSYYCIWKPSPAPNPSSSSSSFLQHRGIIYSGGDVNALIQDNTEATKIKLLLRRYKAQHFIPSSETGLAGLAMESRRPQFSYVQSIIGPTHQIFKDASIQTLLWIPLHGGAEVMELGTTQLVLQGVHAFLAQVLTFLNEPICGDNMVKSTTNSVPMVDFDTNLFCLDTNTSANTTLFGLMDTLETPFDHPNTTFASYNSPHHHNSNNISITDVLEDTNDHCLNINNAMLPTRLNHDDQFSIDQLQSLVNFAPSLEETHDLSTLPNVNQQQYFHNDAPHHGSSTEGTLDTHFSSPLSSCPISSSHFQNSSPISPMTSWSSSHSISSPNSFFKPWTPLHSSIERKRSSSEVCPSLLTRCLRYWLPSLKSLEPINSNVDANMSSASTHSTTQLLPVNGIARMESSTRIQFANEGSTQHVISERKRRQRQKENFNALKALVPSITKRDKVTILQHSVRYIKQLKHQIEELEQKLKDTKAISSNGVNGHISNMAGNQPPLVKNHDPQSKLTEGFPLPNGARYLATCHSYGPPSTFHLAMSLDKNIKDINNIMLNIISSIKSKGLEFVCAPPMPSSSSSNLNIKIIVKTKEVTNGTLCSNTLVEIEDWWRQLALAIETT